MNNLVSNLNYFKSLIQPTTKIMVMVKAFSYGLGTYDVAKLLENNHVDYLGVANTYEGIELRNAGINLPIMVMKPEVDSFDLVVANKLTPTIFSIFSLKKLIESVPHSATISIAIKIDTGMHRLGFDKSEVSELIELIRQHSFIKIESIFSHLAATDEEQHHEFTLDQIDAFNLIFESISSSFDYTIEKHILNTNGIINYNNSQMDMVRLGIGLYGVCSDPTVQKQLKSASLLKSKIAQIKHINKGETIGYNRKGIANSDLMIATIPVGYADGLSRALGNGAWSMIINGVKAKTIGNICMDMVMIDVSGIECNEGDEVFVFSDLNTISEMAHCIETIPYEILTSYSPRVRRVFLDS